MAFLSWLPPKVTTEAVQASDRLGGIPSVHRLLASAATVNATLVKNAPGRLYNIHGRNAAATVLYMKLYNKATVPSEVDTPVKTLVLPPTANFDFSWADIGLYFSAGIGYRFTTAGADNSTAAIAANDILALNLDYA